RGLEQPPAVLQRVQSGRVRRLVTVACRRVRFAGSVVLRPADNAGVERGRGQVEDEHLLAKGLLSDGGGGGHAISFFAACGLRLRWVTTRCGRFDTRVTQYSGSNVS